MSLKFLRKQILAICAILALGAMIIFVWVAFSKGAFSTQQQVTVKSASGDILNRTTHKELEITHLEDFETNDVEFVKPMKISPPSNNGREKPRIIHPVGHFREKQMTYWDRHPFYEIDAFNRKLYLELDSDDGFVAPDLHIITNIHENYTQRTKHDRRLSGCFYTGIVTGDKNSSVTVSLCNGMTGVIQTNDSSYYIEPIEKFVEGSPNSLVHRIKKLLHPIKEVNDVNSDSMEFFENNENKTIIEDDFYEETATILKNHHLNKRSVQWYEPDSSIEGICDVITEQVRRTSPEVLRPRRNAEWNSNARKSNVSYVKVLIVADNSMAKTHGNAENLVHYILMLMHRVAYLYRHSTIGNAVAVSVVQIQILNSQFPNTNSAEMLNKFCDWTQRNIQDKVHNVAVLLTKDYICRNESLNQHCTTLGVAQLDSMCHSGCAVVRDKGLASSSTIAHELGHILSMPHDDDKKCERFNKHLSLINIMSKVIKRDTKPFTWSPCSKYYITEFLNSAGSSCLWSRPTNDYLPTYAYTQALPGFKIDLNNQCELEFGKGRKACLTREIPSGPCEHLYCTTNSTEYACTSNFSPWADGTKCGDEQVCFNGQCQYEYKLVPVDGGWGPWQPYGACSRTCGGGITASFRFCNSPEPTNGGLYCIGENVRYESCNTKDCEIGSKDFRTKQCSEFDGTNEEIFNSTTPIFWYPDFDIENPEDYCRLFCIPNKIKPSFRLQDKVLDGTKCGPSGFGICVNGICKPGGCDNILDSKVVLDDCGICGGDNSRCQEISGTYNKPAETIGYYKVVVIPKGSSNVNISQDSYPRVDDNYLVLDDGETGDSLLNGNYMANTDELFVNFGAVKLKYSGSNNPVEWIISEKNKKLPKDLIVKVLSMKNLSPPSIHYRYLIDVKEAPSYGWQLNHNQPWTKCNSICEGKQYRKPMCIDLSTQNEVKPSLCDNVDDSQIQKRDCNMQCQLTWNIASKSACLPQCGTGFRKIHYNCMKVSKKKPNDFEYVNDKHCTILAPPPVMEMCNTICNSTRWHYSQWSECSRTCGGGIQRRTATCVDDRYTHIDDSYCNDREMIIEQICNTENCPVWTLAETSPCSKQCGGGYKNLTYYCVLDGRIHEHDYCDANTKPPEREACNEQACGRWAPLGIYHSCSVTCGEGIEKRKFACKKFDSDDIVLDVSYCRDQEMPTETRACYRPKCELLRRPSIKDEWFNTIIPEPYKKNYKWTPGDWSACTQSCGEGGRSKQYFKCIDDSGDQNELMCDPKQKPNKIIKCNQFACPKWSTGGWSPSCDSNCEKQRQVRCTDTNGKVVDDVQCDGSIKPQNSTKCKLLECSYITNTISRRYFDPSNDTTDKRYRWKIGPWKPCSNFCGKGTRRRHVECEDVLNDIVVVDALCRHLKKPRVTKPCERYSCRFAWIEGYWSACSASCGTGIKKRNVTCHKVYRGGTIDPVPLPDLYQNKIHHQNYCSVYNKPPTAAKCILAHCGDRYIWQPEAWGQCSHKCGRRGRQIRVIQCIDAWSKHRVARHLCRKNLKPPRKRKCNQWKCLYKSCREIKHYMGTKENRDYVISLHGRPVQIHCYKMDTPEPLEYISLHPDSMNFAEIYDKRLLDVRTCPYNGQRRDNCQCDFVGSDRSGFTKFWKVRLNITAMRIVGDDFTFSRQLKGTRVPYGTAGDCYSTVQNCAQGRFEVDLSHTSFRLSSSVRWERLGPYASAEIRRSDTTASGKCGGYCGNCIPDPNIGLAVEVT